MPNIAQNISRHNKKIMNEYFEAKKIQDLPNPPPPPKYCNCNAANRDNCPLEGFCNVHQDGRPVENVVYSAKVTPCDDDEVPLNDPLIPVETYGGSTVKFKKRWYGHNTDMNNPNKRHATTLSNHVWDLKDEDINYFIKWKILAFAKPFASHSMICRLCLEEIWQIMFNPEDTTLNRRTEFYNYCKHKISLLFHKP